jgi:hypothetical protein
MPLRCIIVDDYQPFLTVARVKLERQGMAVAGLAANGAEALRQARELREQGRAVSGRDHPAARPSRTVIT